MAVHAGSIWLDQNWGRFPTAIWVAANASGVVAEHPDYDQMIDGVRRQGIDLSDVTILLVPRGVVQ
jgi:hypothetical protein